MALALLKPINFKIMYFTDRTIIQMDAIELMESIDNMFDKKLEEMLERLEKKELIYTRDEAAQILHSSPNTISTLVKQGILKNKGFGRKILISSHDIDRVKGSKRFKIKV
jgi:hypothetical protein